MQLRNGVDNGLSAVCFILPPLRSGRVLPVRRKNLWGALTVQPPYHLERRCRRGSVSLFHAADVPTVPRSTILDWIELNLLDNGKPPRKIVALQSMTDFTHPGRHSYR